MQRYEKRKILFQQRAQTANFIEAPTANLSSIVGSYKTCPKPNWIRDGKQDTLKNMAFARSSGQVCKITKFQ